MGSMRARRYVPVSTRSSASSNASNSLFRFPFSNRNVTLTPPLRPPTPSPARSHPRPSKPALADPLSSPTCPTPFRGGRVRTRSRRVRSDVGRSRREDVGMGVRRGVTLVSLRKDWIRVEGRKMGREREEAGDGRRRGRWIADFRVGFGVWPGTGPCPPCSVQITLPCRCGESKVRRFRFVASRRFPSSSFLRRNLSLTLVSSFRFVLGHSIMLRPSKRGSRRALGDSMRTSLSSVEVVFEASVWEDRTFASSFAFRRSSPFDSVH